MSKNEVTYGAYEYTGAYKFIFGVRQLTLTVYHYLAECLMPAGRNFMTKFSWEFCRLIRQAL